MTAVALLLALSATAACSGAVSPVAPSPGIDSRTPSDTTPQATPSTPGPGETRPGIRLTAVPRPDGSFDVTEDVMLPQATGILQLQLPASGEHLPGMMSRTTPIVTNLKVLADGTSVPLQNTTVTGADYLPLTTAATRIRMTYRLSGSVVLATPSESQRAGAALRPLAGITEGTLPTNVAVTTGLLNAVCPLLTEPRCAVGDPPRLSIQSGIPANKALVVLQLDLPR
ncbi:hypothetical protein AB0E69_14900 [Kribbella sp. NPDC026611]|uniref:hypothetical protein n=1 Tax=Kribbella sp. NPDC026611 TaxID=3154911 RepID=UPI0033E6C7F4